MYSIGISYISISNAQSSNPSSMQVVTALHICSPSGRNENGLRGRSGVRGLSAFANSSSPESALAVRASPPIDANPVWCSTFCCACTDSGG